MVVGDTRLVVLKSGNVGIGTTNPGSRLEVLGGSGSNLKAGAWTANSTFTALSLNGDLGLGANFYTQIGGADSHFYINRQTGGDLVFRINNVDQIRLLASGNVGIGMASPSDSLHIAGTARISDSVTVGDTVFVVNSKSGNVGIGTTNPGAKLQIVNSADITHLQISYNSTGSADWNIKRDLTSGALSIQGTQTGNNNIWLAPTSGNVGIGTTSPDTNLSVNGGASKVGGGSWATFSDGRLKNVNGNFTAGTAELMKINPVRYRYRPDNGAGIRDGAEHIGLVAQEVQAAIPEAVSSSNKGYLMLDNDPVIFAMLNAIKEQQAMIQEQGQENAELKAKLASLTKKVEELAERR